MATTKVPLLSKTALQSDRSDIATNDLGVNLDNALVSVAETLAGLGGSHRPSHLLHITNTHDYHLYTT